MVKNLPAVQETPVRSLGWKDPLGKGMATHSSIVAWRIPWTDDLGRPQSLCAVSKSQTPPVTNTFTLHFRISKSALTWQQLVGAFPTASSSFSSLIEPQFLEGLHLPPHIPPSWNSTARNSGMLCSFLALGYAKWKGKESFVDGSYQEVIHPSIDFYSSEDALSVTGPSDPPFTFGLPCF